MQCEFGFACVPRDSLTSTYGPRSQLCARRCADKRARSGKTSFAPLNSVMARFASGRDGSTERRATTCSARNRVRHSRIPRASSRGHSAPWRRRARCSRIHTLGVRRPRRTGANYSLCRRLLGSGAIRGAMWGSSSGASTKRWSMPGPTSAAPRARGGSVRSACRALPTGWNNARRWVKVFTGASRAVFS